MMMKNLKGIDIDAMDDGNDIPSYISTSSLILAHPLILMHPLNHHLIPTHPLYALRLPILTSLLYTNNTFSILTDGTVMSPQAQAEALKKQKKLKPTRGGGGGFGSK